MSEAKTPEFEPPQACVNRIIKAALPDNFQVTKDARAAFTRAAGIFIFYLTHWYTCRRFYISVKCCSANDFCKENKRQTIYASDILDALKELDFEEFVGPLEEFLEEYRHESENKKTSKGNKDHDNEEENEADTSFGGHTEEVTDDA